MTDGPAYLVTGATGPMAGATVALLAKRGDRLLLVGRDRERLALAERVHGVPGQVETYQADVSEPGGAAAAVGAAVDRFGGVAGLVHLVGAFAAGPALRTDAAELDRLVRANLFSAVLTAQAVIPRLTGGGRLVFFASPLAQEPLPGLSGYAATKAALVAWLRSLSHEVKHLGVHVNTVVMTMADTPEARAERPQMNFDEAVTPEQVAKVVGFLTSDAADGLYGAQVPVLGRFGFTTTLIGRPPGGPGPGRG
ncbi:SDR family NAD(P)-dependent oxidoreductase [Plantactinospora endophytica]|uniref:Oxidoreductase n=1 Tax=Plantactinospora endophytica TaxID=673535 RepID=A0ABQ4EBI7_9ACTN|nr:SDR family oxidoreductase [Plantactinospora endophytica]GIG92068.1 oxidoreductase [Plantactinospora endophytica]